MTTLGGFVFALLALIFFVGVPVLLGAWARAIYFNHKLLTQARAVDPGLWKELTTVSGIETSGNPVAMSRFIFGHERAHDRRPEEYRRQARQAMALALRILVVFISLVLSLFAVLAIISYLFVPSGSG